MPPTDPRFLDADEEQIRGDLMVLALRFAAVSLDADRREVETLASSEQGIEALERSASAFHADPGTQRALATLRGKGDATGDAMPARMTLRRAGRGDPADG